MFYRRDPLDRRRFRRLGWGYVASVVLHALFAALFFAVVTNSSQQGANESIEGGSIVTLENRAPAVPAHASAEPREAAPVPHAPIAPPHHAPAVQPPHQPLPPARHELSKFAPTAPPMPTPAPQTSEAPLPQPTSPVIEPKPENDRAAVPISVPSAAAVAVAVKVPPTAAPSPVPTAAPTTAPSPKPVVPTAAPTVRATAQPTSAATAVPTAAAVARASAVPSASPAPAPQNSAAPAAKAGVASPAPTPGTQTQPAKGAAPTPGPKGEGSPGPRPGAAGPRATSAPRPLAVPATPSPSPRPSSGPKPASGTDINAKLRAMLPSNPVNPTTKSYSTKPTIEGKLEPTPPPEVLAQTKYIFEEAMRGTDEHMKMWVTQVRGDGITRTCTGWLVRYPGPMREHTIGGNIFNSNGQGGTLGNGMSGLVPIVEANATTACSANQLKPFAASPAPSP